MGVSMTTNTIKRVSIFFILFLETVATAQIFGSADDVLTARMLFPVEQLARQHSYRCLIEIDINPAWHINSHTPLEEYLIPTEINFQPVDGISFGKIQYTSPELRRLSFSQSQVSVYEGTVYIMIPVTVAPDLSADSVELKATLSFQACNDQSCLPPAEKVIVQKISISDADAQVTQINQAVIQKALSLFEQPQESSESSELKDIISKSGFIYALLFIFLGGLALNLTPCVYPLIPITISYFGGQSGGKKGALLLRATIYVLGMAITYSILGVAAALSGDLLGSALQNPLVLLFVALVLIGLALSMFGLYEIRVPQSLAQIGGANRSGYLGTLFMGLTVGLIAAPCIGPFVLGLLTYVSDIGDAFTGFIMFFVLALGLGTPFLLLGVFSGAATNLPRSGAWMIWVRKIFGFVLIGMALYFLEPLFPGKNLYLYSIALVALAAGVYLGWLEKTTGSRGFKIARALTGILFIVLAVVLILSSGSKTGAQISWQIYDEQLLASAKEAEKPVIIDFYADWCIPCKELDQFTFSDPEVIALSEKFMRLKQDLTKFQGDANTAIRQRFNIKGVPTIVFIGTDGDERGELRLVGYEDADKFLERMIKTIP
jgi:thiol:disulfide interchange protein DsbD